MSRKARYKKWLRLQKNDEVKQPGHNGHQPEINPIAHHEPHEKEKGIKGIYYHHYKALFLIPFLLLILAIAQISYQAYTTGDFINRAVSLKGGVTLTVPFDKDVDVIDFQAYLASSMPNVDFFVRTFTRAGRPVGIIIDADLDMNDKTSLDRLVSLISSRLDIDLKEGDFTTEGTGAALGSSFFKETAIALIIAFMCMGLVVFFSFRTFVPSIAVILAAFSDMVVTLAIVNMLDMKITTAGIAAFLMLIGYSVDTDILLSTRVLKRKEGTVMDRIYGAIKTGMTMVVTTLVAVIVTLSLTESETIKQIMTIVLIGLLVDIINTWIQNTGILRWYLEMKNTKPKEAAFENVQA